MLERTGTRTVKARSPQRQVSKLGGASSRRGFRLLSVRGLIVRELGAQTSKDNKPSFAPLAALPRGRGHTALQRAAEERHTHAVHAVYWCQPYVAHQP